jgi:class 3 adenylate cyclase
MIIERFERFFFGEAPNLAARVQMVATPGTVLRTADTHRLVSGLFVVEEREAQEGVAAAALRKCTVRTLEIGR